MIIVNIYHGGQIIKGPQGADYSLPAKFSISVTENSPLEELKTEIYSGLELDRSACTLSIRVRSMITGPSGEMYFTLIPITGENIWKMALNNAALCYNYRYLEMVVEEIHISSDGRSNLNRRSEIDRPSSSQIHESHEEVGGEFDRNEENVNDGNDTNEIEDVVDDENYESEGGDEIEGENIAIRWRESIPFVNRGDKHSAEQFNDVSGMVDSDEAFFGIPKRFDNPLAEGRTFATKQHLKTAIHDVHIKSNIELETPNSSKSKFVVKCKDRNCYWRLYAKPTKQGSAWKICTNPVEHSCHASATRPDHRQLTSRMIAEVIRNALKKNLELKLSMVAELVRTAYPTVQPSYNKLWRGREVTVAELFGSWEKAYEMLPPLFNAMQAANPGTKVTFESYPSTQYEVRIFRRVAWAYGPCIQGWRYVRPVISVDAGFMSERYGGKFFAACAYDAENQLLPLAFGIAEEENNDNWGWFMQWLRREVVGPGRICVISDGHASIRNVFEQPHWGWCEQRGEAVHRLCAQHVAQNFHSKCKNKDLVETMKWTVRRKKLWRFEEGMENIKNEHKVAYEHLLNTGKKVYNDRDEPRVPQKWAQCYDGGCNRWGLMTSNGSEALNSVFRIARTLPITAIVEESFYKCVEWYVKRKSTGNYWASQNYVFCPKIRAKILKRGEKGRTLKEITPLTARFNAYEVMVRNEEIKEGVIGSVKYDVFFQEGMPYCNCQKPQLTGIPCCHVLAVCSLRHLDEEQYVSSYYSVQNFLNTWAGEFRGYGNPHDWSMYVGPKIRPDPLNLNKGRRKHKRIVMEMDQMEGRVPVRLVDGQTRRSRQRSSGGGASTSRRR